MGLGKRIHGGVGVNRLTDGGIVLVQPKVLRAVSSVRPQGDCTLQGQPNN